jgi:hypothetical protein
MLGVILTLVLSIFGFASSRLFPVVNATYVENPITQDTIWTLADSPFVVIQDVMIYPNVTLTIEPGVEVRFGGDFSLTVSGRLSANGAGKTIAFTSNKMQQGVGDWNMIVFNSPLKSTLIDCFFAYAENGIFIENGDVEIRDSTITLSVNGITAVNGKVRLQNSTVSLCQQSGINITNSELFVENSIIEGNDGNGICIIGTRQVTIQKNAIVENGNGILLTGNETSNVNINQNIISANTQNGIQIAATDHTGITIIDNIISSNERGLYISSPTSMQITNNSIAYNAMGILCDEGDHTVNYNDIYENTMGFDVEANATANAEYNYWGDPTGPYHPSLNPNGKGNRVGGNGVNLDFIFFLSKSTGYINAPPIAILQADKTAVRPNVTVMFFATNSFDSDGRIDRYLLDFGDGNSSGWTTLSIVTHKYSLIGAYDATLRVRDDYGATSSSTVLRINVQNLPPLQVNINVSKSMINEEEQVPITVYVTDGTQAVGTANVTLFSVKGGYFTESTGLTNSSGYFSTTFISPDVVEMANIRIVAKTFKTGYTDGSDYKYLNVAPYLAVQIIANPDVVKSEGTTQISVYVRSNQEAVANASVTMLSTDGSLSRGLGSTDSNGIFSTVFTAPLTTTFLSVNLTATAMKEGYVDGVGQTLVYVDPKSLGVQIIAGSTTIVSEAGLNVTVSVDYDAVPIVGANVTVTVGYGSFSTTSDLTDTDGSVRFFFSAPLVNEQLNVTMTAHATKAKYAEGQSQLKITINPRTFKIQITSPDVDSGESSTVVVSVTCKEDEKPVANATVTISSREGNFSIITQTTSSSGVCSFTFNAPETTTQSSVVITANVTKEGYIAEGNQTTIAVNPKYVPPPEGGWPIITILLIIIPIVIAVIIVVLIKLKVIVLSSGEEEE